VKKTGVKHIVLFNCSILCELEKIPTSNRCMQKVIKYFKK
jgi:hypothetical protein